MQLFQLLKPFVVSKEKGATADVHALSLDCLAATYDATGVIVAIVGVSQQKVIVQ